MERVDGSEEELSMMEEGSRERRSESERPRRGEQKTEKGKDVLSSHRNYDVCVGEQIFHKSLHRPGG